jgi:hypothetical protein
LGVVGIGVEGGGAEDFGEAGESAGEDGGAAGEGFEGGVAEAFVVRQQAEGAGVAVEHFEFGVVELAGGDDAVFDAEPPGEDLGLGEAGVEVAGEDEAGLVVLGRQEGEGFDQAGDVFVGFTAGDEEEEGVRVQPEAAEEGIALGGGGRVGRGRSHAGVDHHGVSAEEAADVGAGVLGAGEDEVGSGGLEFEPGGPEGFEAGFEAAGGLGAGEGDEVVDGDDGGAHLQERGEGIGGVEDVGLERPEEAAQAILLAG